MSQRVHPVLIRNDHNALLQVVVEVKQKEDVRLRSVAFSLDGTDNLSDLESLELFYTGEKREFATETVFGKPAQPAARDLFPRGSNLTRRDARVLVVLQVEVEGRLVPQSGCSLHVD